MSDSGPMSIRQKAEVLVSAVKEALASGTLHFNAAGKPLLTVREVVDCLVEEGGVTLREPKVSSERSQLCVCGCRSIDHEGWAGACDHHPECKRFRRAL